MISGLKQITYQCGKKETMNIAVSKYDDWTIKAVINLEHMNKCSICRKKWISQGCDCSACKGDKTN